MQDIHLALFEFVGRMLGKAIYEVGVVMWNYTFNYFLYVQRSKTTTGS